MNPKAEHRYEQEQEDCVFKKKKKKKSSLACVLNPPVSFLCLAFFLCWTFNPVRGLGALQLNVTKALGKTTINEEGGRN